MNKQAGVAEVVIIVIACVIALLTAKPMRDNWPDREAARTKERQEEVLRDARMDRLERENAELREKLEVED